MVVRLAALPAACYAVQNVLAQVGYQNLDSLTYNLLNQTKVMNEPAMGQPPASLSMWMPACLTGGLSVCQTIAAAVCLFVLTGKRQSGPQLVALALLLIACTGRDRQRERAARASLPPSPHACLLPACLWWCLLQP